jgi:ABC-type transport system substrate-binding protein
MVTRGFRFGRLLAAAVAVSFVVAACGSDGDGADDGTTDSAVDADAGGDADGGGGSDDGVVTEDPDQTAEAVAGGTLVYGTYGEAPSYDPLTTLAVPSHGAANLAIYDSLMRLDEQGEAVPYLAESMETTDDGTTWVMTLRPDVVFHDGEPLDADAVVFNTERHLEGTSRAAAQVEPIETVEATGPLEVTFTLAHPWSAFPTIFTVAPGYIGSPAAIEQFGEDYGRNPVGAGPFEVESLIPDDRTVLVRNDTYWQVGLPVLDSIEFRPIPDHQVRNQAVLTGDIDITYQIQAAEIAQAGEGDVDVYFTAGNGGEGMLVNTAMAPFDDVRVRRALANGLNLDLINSVRFDGNMIEAQGPFAPDSPWYRDVYGEYPAFDPEAGKALLDEYAAETGAPVEVELSCPNSPDRVVFCELIQQMWSEQLGITVTLQFFETGEYVTRLADGNFEVSATIIPHFDDPDFLYGTFHSTAPGNSTNFSNADMDAALERGRESADADERAEAYGEVAQILADELPMLWYARSQQALITQPHVTGVDHYSNMTLLLAELGRTS